MANQTQERAEQLSGARTLTPAVDIYENDQELLLKADLPGVEKENVRIHLDKDVLVVEGKRVFEGEDEVVYRRTFTVAQVFDAEKVNARLERGVLEVHLPKADRIRPRQIPVQAG